MMAWLRSLLTLVRQLVRDLADHDPEFDVEWRSW